MNISFLFEVLPRGLFCYLKGSRQAIERIHNSTMKALFLGWTVVVSNRCKNTNPEHIQITTGCDFARLSGHDIC
jgi:hypothetical protein